jgi:hypothetical protein
MIARARLPSGRGAQVKIAPAGELQAAYEAALRERRAEFGAAPSTVEALVYEFRTYGLAALAGENCRRRLGELSEAQVVASVIERLVRLRPSHPAITDELIFRLGEQLS